MLNHLVTYNVAKVHEDAPLKFVELIQLLRLVSYERIDALWSQYKVKPAYRSVDNKIVALIHHEFLLPFFPNLI